MMINLFYPIQFYFVAPIQQPPLIVPILWHSILELSLRLLKPFHPGPHLQTRGGVGQVCDFHYKRLSRHLIIQRSEFFTLYSLTMGARYHFKPLALATRRRASRPYPGHVPWSARRLTQGPCQACTVSSIRVMSAIVTNTPSNVLSLPPISGIDRPPRDWHRKITNQSLQCTFPYIYTRPTFISGFCYAQRMPSPWNQWRTHQQW